MKVELMDIVRSVVARCNLQITRLAPPFEELHGFDLGIRGELDPNFDWEAMGKAMLAGTPHRQLMLVEDMFSMKYLIFRLPDEESGAYIIGPWRRKLSPEKYREAFRWLSARMPAEMMKQLEHFYGGVCIMEREEEFCSMVLSIISVAYPGNVQKGESGFHIESYREFLPMSFGLDDRKYDPPTFEREISMTLIAERYQNENELMDAVARGDTSRATTLLQQRRRYRYTGNRFFGELQERRNAMIILNVLLRKAIEGAKVHPYYIDQISARYYDRIRTVAYTDIEDLPLDMIASYCRYVKDYSLQKYPVLIRNTIDYINLNLSAPLSLRMLAKQFYITPSYLSNLFRSEVGVTLIDYISTRRMERAAYLLTETELSVADISEHVGIVDVNYFTKMFKKAYGKPPTRYRVENREQKAQLAPSKKKNV